MTRRLRRAQESRTALALLAALLIDTPGNCASATLAQAEPKLRVTKSLPKPNPAVLRAFAAFTAGDLDTAEREYGQALAAEPSNADALNGAALIALRKNERPRAETLYRRAIAVNPRDAVAQAGLAGLSGQADALTTESTLKSLLASQPEQSGLHFALGNLYAASNRWGDARQAFFSAHATDPDQPDYLFNLAVSLDHLHQTSQARRYYEKALSAADRRAAAFDRADAAARLRELAR